MGNIIKEVKTSKKNTWTILFQKLKNKLLKKGGNTKSAFNGFQMPEYLESEITEKELEELLLNGKFFSGKNKIMFKGIPSMCHLNIKKYCIKNKDILHYYGFALNKDGIWRFHSFGIDKNTLKVIEGSAPDNILYFGILASKQWIKEIPEDV